MMITMMMLITMMITMRTTMRTMMITMATSTTIRVMMLHGSSGWAAGGSRVMDWRETQWQHTPSYIFCTLMHISAHFLHTF